MGFTRTKATNILSGNITGETYIGLSTTEPNANGGNFSQPSSTTGYERVRFGEVDTSKAAQIANKNIIFFNETLNGGYGTITHFGLFESKTASTPFFVGALNAPLTVGEGYVPIFRAHQLVIGLDKEVLDSYG